MPNDPPEQVKPYLDEIADRLWSKNAAVMVGAGFSRNAKPVGTASASFPSWNELGDSLFEKLHGRSPDKEAKYLNLLKLAEQVEAAFGRPALDDFLRREIPDLTYEPSPLHSQLLNLPWQDVFTTNYDTLLERARASVTLYHYDVVAKKEDLLYVNESRIVKLHGSFPSPPFVITEEDYRRYPSDHAPFVNTVRQSLLENTLCLIGFSGDDPNFLQWIGWIRDHIGKEYSPKIYLVGVFNTLSGADRKLLDRRGIVIVDLSVFSIDHEEAFDRFLSYLNSRKSHAADWPTVSTDVPSWPPEPGSENYVDIVSEWRRQRGEYPGWVVVPEDRRRFLWLHTESWLSRLSPMSSADRAQLDTPLDLELAFEAGWRLDRCLLPLIGELPAFLEEIATKYGDTKLSLPEKTGWTTASVFEAVVNIRLWLLRHYREEGLDEEWQAVAQALEKEFARLLPEHVARFRMEEALQALFRFDPTEAKRLLTDWQPNENLPFWEAKRAALMAELGEAAAARQILETSLSAIRQQLNLKPITEDYTLISQESVVMLLLWAVERGIAAREWDTDDSNRFNEMSERWNELARYRCDPQREIAWFSARLRNPVVRWKPESTTHSFDLGYVSTTFHSETDPEAVAAYGLLRMYEDIGMPYRMEHMIFVKDPVESTLPRVRPYSPHWALTNIVRLGNAKAADELFDREYVAGLRANVADRFLEIYLPAFERTIAMADEPELSEARSFELLAKTLPEVFSRLCYKCSPEYRERLLAALRAIYGSKRRQMFAEVGKFAGRLLDSMSVEELARAVPSLIDFPVPERLSEIEMLEFFNPVRNVRLPPTVRRDALVVTEEKIDELLDRIAPRAHDRAWSMTSLVWLYERGKLNEQQSERLGDALWYGVEAPRVPVVPGYYSFACITLPHPSEIDPESRVRDHLSSIIDEGLGDSRLDDGVLDMVRISGSNVKWSKTEALELLAKLSGWWAANKHLLLHRTPMPFGSPAVVTNRTVVRVIRALSAVFTYLPADQDADVATNTLEEFLTDLERCNIPAKALEAATLTILPENRGRVLDRVAAAMPSSQHDVVADAVFAAGVLARTLVEQDARDHFAAIGEVLVEGVRWRHRPALVQRLRVVADLVEKQPWFLSTEALSGLLAGLAEIAEETSTGVRGNDQDGVIPIRAAAASLAFSLFEYHRKSGLDEPEAIRRWRELCSDPDEFSEVKNSWVFAGG